MPPPYISMPTSVATSFWRLRLASMLIRSAGSAGEGVTRVSADTVEVAMGDGLRTEETEELGWGRDWDEGSPIMAWESANPAMGMPMYPKPLWWGAIWAGG